MSVTVGRSEVDNGGDVTLTAGATIDCCKGVK